jgi:hypothetical protein
MKFSFDISQYKARNAGTVIKGGLGTGLAAMGAGVHLPPPLMPWGCGGLALGGTLLIGKGLNDLKKIEHLEDAWAMAVSSTPNPLSSNDYNRVKTFLAKSGNTTSECTHISVKQLKEHFRKGRELESLLKRK